MLKELMPPINFIGDANRQRVHLAWGPYIDHVLSMKPANDDDWEKIGLKMLEILTSALPQKEEEIKAIMEKAKAPGPKMIRPKLEMPEKPTPYLKASEYTSKSPVAVPKKASAPPKKVVAPLPELQVIEVAISSEEVAPKPKLAVPSLKLGGTSKVETTSVINPNPTPAVPFKAPSSVPKFSPLIGKK